MINSKLKTVFARWNDENKVKVIETIGDDEMKSLLGYDRARAYELFRMKLDDEYFNGLFEEYYAPIKQALDEKRANVKKRTPKLPANRIEEIDQEIRNLQAQIAKLQIERTKEVEAEKERAVNAAKKMIEQLSPEQREALLASLQG